jgi:origin recognition complex subunit 5
MDQVHSVPITVVLASQLPWDEVRPPLGASDEPLHVFLPPLSREGKAFNTCLGLYSRIITETFCLLRGNNAHPLYPRFLELLLASIYNLLPAALPAELEVIALTLWPIYTASLPTHAEQHLLPHRQAAPDALPLTITVKLLTDLKVSSAYAMTAAIETLLPQKIGRDEFQKAFMAASSSAPSLPKAAPVELGLYAKYLLVAGYLASYNPAASDLKMFGRGTEATGGKKRRGGGNRRGGYGKARVGKVSSCSQKLLTFCRYLRGFSALKRSPLSVSWQSSRHCTRSTLNGQRTFSLTLLRYRETRTRERRG